MAELTLARPPRARLVIGLGLALLVQGAGWLLLRGGAPLKPHPAASWTEIRLLPPREPPPAPAPPRPSTAAPQRPSGFIPTPEDPAPVSDPTLAPPPPTAPAPPAPPAPPAVAPLPSGRTTLNLALPARRAASEPAPGSMAEQATRDPRGNSEHRGVEWAVQDAAGTLPVVVQQGTSGSGTTLIRQGSKCTRVTENRVAALNPMDQRLRGAPPVVGPCFTK